MLTHRRCPFCTQVCQSLKRHRCPKQGNWSWTVFKLTNGAYGWVPYILCSTMPDMISTQIDDLPLPSPNSLLSDVYAIDGMISHKQQIYDDHLTKMMQALDMEEWAKAVAKHVPKLVGQTCGGCQRRMLAQYEHLELNGGLCLESVEVRVRKVFNDAVDKAGISLNQSDPLRIDLMAAVMEHCAKMLPVEY